MKIINILFFYLSFSLSQSLSADEIITRMDKKDKPNDIKATFIMESYKEDEKRVTKFISWSQNSGEKQIMWFLDGKLSYDDVVEKTIFATRQLAKRQLTWSRGHMKSWELIYSSNFNDLYKKAINKIF